MSSMEIAVGSLGRIGQIEYYQQIADRDSLKNLYDFQVINKIQMTSQLDNCLQTQYSKQFYSYQSCYGIFGQKTNKSDLGLIKFFISLQNQFIPFKQSKYNIASYTLYLDQQLFFSQYQGEYMKTLDKEILNAIFFMAFFKLPGYFKQISGETGQMLLMFNQIPGTKIAYGTLLNQNQQHFFQLTKQMQYYKQRLLGVLDNGIILTDTQNVDCFGLMFQNTSITGLNETQFEKIKNFTIKNSTVVNECELQVQSQILCLIDVNQQNKLIFPRVIQNQGAPFLLIVIIDGDSISSIRDEFDGQLVLLNHKIIANIVIPLSVTLVICFILQLIFITKLNKPLKQLQNIAKFHIKNQEYKLLKFTRLKKAQSQIQKLADSFFDLINQDNNYKNIQNRVNAENYIQKYPISGLLQYRYQKKIILSIKQSISNLPTY
ncbi:hypothetical protein pb186bvf_005001 [Paramecium bursaria]